MLSFLTDQPGNLPEQNTAAAGPSRQKPAGLNAKRTRQSSIALTILLCAVVTALFLMIRNSQPQTAKAEPTKQEQSQIEAAIKRLTGLSDELATHMDQLVQRFHQLSAVAQVATNELVKNPFELEIAAGILPQVELAAAQKGVEPNEPQDNSKPAEPTAEQIERMKAEELARRQAELERQRLAELAAQKKALEAKVQQIRQTALGMRLQSILRLGSENRCVIDGQVYAVGDSIRGFELKRIEDSIVELLWSEPEVTITLKIAE